jgi:hypothetical protein
MVLTAPPPPDKPPYGCTYTAGRLSVTASHTHVPMLERARIVGISKTRYVLATPPLL